MSMNRKNDNLDGKYLIEDVSPLDIQNNENTKDSNYEQ
jgi:hypothetical protein